MRAGGARGISLGNHAMIMGKAIAPNPGDCSWVRGSMVLLEERG